MVQTDIDALSAAATARVFSALLWLSQMSNPVADLDEHSRRCDELLSDIHRALATPERLADPVGVSAVFEEKAIGHYDHDVVGIGLEKLLIDMAPAFSGLPLNPAMSIADWMDKHGSTPHGKSWLLERAASLLVADSIQQSSTVH